MGLSTRGADISRYSLEFGFAVVHELDVLESEEHLWQLREGIAELNRTLELDRVVGALLELGLVVVDG